MTLSTTARRTSPYLGNGVTVSFPFAWKVWADVDIQVVITNALGVETIAVLNSAYTVTRNADQDTTPGGSISYPATVPVGSTLQIIGALTIEQPTDLPDGGSFRAEEVENAMDRTVALIQELSETAGTGGGGGGATGLPTPVANLLLGWNAAGTALENKDPDTLNDPDPVGGVNLNSITMTSAAPASRRWEYPATNPAGWNLSGGTCTFDAEFVFNSYWAANPNAHFGIGLRCDLALIATQPRFHGVIMGHLSGIQEGAPHEPTAQIETRATGLDPGGTIRFLLPYSWAPTSEPLQDGVSYKIVITSKVAINAQRYIGYKLWKKNVARSAAGVWAGDLLVDTGDMLDPNTWLDMTKYGLVFFSVFESNLVPWTIDFTNTNVTWSQVEAVSPGTTDRLTRFDIPAPVSGRLLGWNPTNRLVNVDPATLTGGTAVKVAVLGDSMSATNSLMDPAWPDQLAARLNALGAPVEMHNLAKDGWTYNKANTVAQFGTNTMVQQAVALAPDVVIVALGANDAILNVEGRTAGQTQADATSLFAALRAGLPAAKIIYASELMYDSANFAPAALVNKAVPVYLWQLKAAGILTGNYTSECLADATSATTRTRYGDWVTLDAAIKLLATVNTNFTLPYWKACRLGMVGVDNIHLNAVGHLFLSAAAVKTFYTSVTLDALFPNMMSQEYDPWNDPDTVFSAFLTASGTDWVAAAYDLQVAQVSKSVGPMQRINPETWYMPSKGVAKFFPVTGPADSFNVPYWQVRNARPMTAVEVSTGGGAFASAGATTDAYGDAQFPFIAGQFSAAVYTIRYRVGNEVFGPFTYTATAPTEPYLSVAQAGNQVTGASGTFNKPLLSTVAENTGFTYVGGTATVTRAGRYHIDIQIAVDALSDGGALVALIYKNGARYKDGNLCYAEITGTALASSNVSASLRLAVGDTIEAYMFFISSGGALNMTAGLGQSTYMTISWEGF